MVVEWPELIQPVLIPWKIEITYVKLLGEIIKFGIQKFNNF